MLHPYLLNLFFKFFKGILIIGLATNLAMANVLEEEKSQVPGLIQTLEKISDIHKNRFDKLKLKIDQNPIVVSSLDNIENAVINKDFYQNVVFRSDFKYLSLIEFNECNFYALLENNLLKSSEGVVNKVVIDIKNKDGSTQSAIVTTKDFLQFVYKQKCFNNVQIGSLFTDLNLKETVKNLDFPVPKLEKECLEIHQTWLKNPYLPYICKIESDLDKANQAQLLLTRENLRLSQKRQLEKIVGRAKFLSDQIPYFEKSYLHNLCRNIEEPQNFCKPYLSEDVWTKVLNGERRLHILEYKCRNVLNIRGKLNKAHLRKCAQLFNKSPLVCTDKGNNKFPSIFPLPNCNTISDAQNNSHLISYYHDCPANIDNQAITNIHRVVSHHKESKLSGEYESCSSEPNLTFANLIFEYKKNEKEWPLKICFKNKVTEDKECLPYIPGKNPNSSLEEGKVIAKILNKTVGASSNLKCSFVDSKSYAPIRLEYATGCFIVYDSEVCTPFHCDKKIVFDNKEIKGIEYEGIPVFDYFPNSYKDENFSALRLLESVHKLKNSSVKNLTELKAFLKRGKKNIAHGIGCAEDLLPKHFKKSTFNKCSPMPFIIDGFIEKNARTTLILRTAVDDVHSPRLVEWNLIFSAIMAYKNIHPLELWTLYGIK